MSYIKRDYEIVFDGLQIDKDDEKKYISLSKIDQYRMQRIKKFTIVSFIIMFIISIFYGDFNEFNINLSIMPKTTTVIFPIIFYLILAGLIRYAPFSIVKSVYLKSNKTSSNKEKIPTPTFGCIFSFVKFLLSPDLYYSNYFKVKFTKLWKEQNECNCSNKKYISSKENLCIQCFDSIKIMNKYFIKFSNWLNLCFSLILADLIILTLLYGNSDLKSILQVIFPILVYRLISRTFEITTAFYKDVVNVKAKIFKTNDKVKSKVSQREKMYLHEWRNSYLRKPERISLAVHSLIELLISFFLLYLFQYIALPENFIKVEPIGQFFSDNVSMLELALYTTSVTFFNISYFDSGSIFWNVVHVWQVSLSMVLIVLSIAAYLSYDDDIFQRERIFFQNVLSK